MTGGRASAPRRVVWKHDEARSTYCLWDELDVRAQPRRVELPATSLREFAGGASLEDLSDEALTRLMDTLYLEPEEHGGWVVDAGSDEVS